ncbi:MAG: MutS-related protein [Prolixibacteraceae bacterium]
MLRDISAKVKQFAWYRFFAFLLIFLPLVTFGFNWITIVVGIIFLVLFLFLVKKNVQMEKQKNKYAILKKLAENELLALEHKYSHFENGKEFLNTDHSFSYDLDLFGEGSLFQFINRTATQSGRQKLAGWLQNPSFQKSEILKRQGAIDELSQIPNWRLYFLANGLLFKETKELSEEVKNWSAAKLKLEKPKRIKWIINLIPALTLLAIIPAVLGITNLAFYVMILVQWILLAKYRKTISLYFDYFGRKSQLVEKYMQLLQFIEDWEFHAAYLNELQRKIKEPDAASHIFSKLKSRMKEFEYRQNIIVGFVLNSLFLWDIRSTYRLWKWHRKHHKKLADWLETIAETDALISLANLAGNHPKYTFPEIHEGGFIFHAKDLGHPLLHPEKRVDNNLEIDGWSKVLIVTGANMAGKSTFLRAVGINLVLARTGAPVCAKELIFTPVEIYTDMRTTDSLLKDESYFFAELKRIKGVLDKLQNGEKIFVILDEMLKGTNSVDKLNGSKELIRRLLNLKSVSLIATHDLKLSEMEEEYPQQVFNKCFEIRIENNEMVFDYKLSDGVTKTMNATFLMKKMGII